MLSWEFTSTQSQLNSAQHPNPPALSDLVSQVLFYHVIAHSCTKCRKCEPWKDVKDSPQVRSSSITHQWPHPCPPLRILYCKSQKTVSTQKNSRCMKPRIWVKVLTETPAYCEQHWLHIKCPQSSQRPYLSTLSDSRFFWNFHEMRLLCLLSRGMGKHHLRWWSVDFLAPLFTWVSKTCGLRSDDMIKSIFGIRCSGTRNTTWCYLWKIHD